MTKSAEIEKQYFAESTPKNVAGKESGVKASSSDSTRQTPREFILVKEGEYKKSAARFRAITRVAEQDKD